MWYIIGHFRQILASQSLALVLNRTTTRQNTYKHKMMQHDQIVPSEQHQTHSKET